MKKYDYAEAVKNDVKDYIESNVELTEYAGDRDRLVEELNDTLFVEDSVTGSTRGSYTSSVQEAEENLAHNLDLLVEAMETFGDNDSVKMLNDPEAADVAIRCYLLSQEIENAIDEIEQENGIDLYDERTFDKVYC